jgi:putative transposase
MAGGRRGSGESAFWGLDVGPNPTDRAKNGTKTNLLVEGQGGPLAVQTAPANWHDSVCLEDLLNSTVVERPAEEQHLCLDKGYDNPTARETLKETDYVPHIATIRPQTQPRRPGRRKARRWVVERTLAWLRKCRALLVRYNKRAENYLGLLQLACALIWYRRYWRLSRKRVLR